MSITQFSMILQKTKHSHVGRLESSSKELLDRFIKASNAQGISFEAHTTTHYVPTQDVQTKDLELGEVIESTETSTTHKATCTVTVTTITNEVHKCLLLASNRKSRKELQKLAGLDLGWVEIATLADRPNENGVDSEPLTASASQ